MQLRIFIQFKYLLIAATLSGAILSSASAAETVSVSTIDANVQRISLDVMKEAYKRIGMEIDVTFMPGKRALQSSSHGKTQAELSRIDGISKKFPNLVKIPVQINSIDVTVFAINETIAVDSWDSLKPYTIGIRRGTAFAENGTMGMNSISLKSEKQLIEMLLAERVDVVVTGKINGQIAINQLSATTVRELTPALQSYPLFHYVHKSQEHLIPKLTEALEQMNAEGVIDEIRESARAKLLAL